MDLRNRTTLVTGASAGLGREIARRIANEHGGNLVLVARRKERLEELAAELRESAKVEVTVLAADLTVTEQVEACFDEATRGRTIHAVVLNAGVTYFGPAAEQPRESIEAIITTNAISLARLATRFGQYFIENKLPGGLLLVSSMTSFSPWPYQAVYGGTKAFVTSFGLALREELAPAGVVVNVFCPAGIATEMLDLSGLSRQFSPTDIGIMDAPSCARYAVDGFIAEQSVTVPGPSNWLASLAMRALPRALVVPLVERAYRAGVKK